MISPLEARILDGNAAALGISVERLMGAAGRALAENVASAHPGERTVFVCGTGNNGGDGYAAAGILRAPVLEFGMPKSEEARRYRSLVEGRCFAYSDAYLKDYDVVVDCVLGTGARGEVREPYRSCLLAINASGRSVVSCDVPSGLGTPAAVRPEMTVTFHDAKTGMDEASCGRIVVADIGFPEDASAAVGPGDMLRYPVPERGSHKGSNGRLVVVGGGPYIGAPALAGAAALRIGADLVRMAVPERCVQPIAAAEPSLVFLSLPGPVLGADSVEAVLQSAEGADALLIGSGLGRDPETQAAVRAIVGSCRKPMVIDADGLNAVAGRGWSFGAPAVLTPHAAELSRLAGGSGPDDARRLSEETGCTVLLKGAEDLVVQGGRSRVNRTGTPAMTVGGTGDVLAGAVAGLLAKGMAPFDAACLGAYICGRAGELAYAEMSYGATAPDVARCIGRALAEGLGRRDGPPARPRGPRAEGGPGPRRDGPAHRRRGAPRRQGVQHPVEDRRHAGGDRLRPRRLRPPDRPRRREGLRPRLDQAGVPGDTGLLRGAAGDVRHRRRRQGEPRHRHRGVPAEARQSPPGHRVRAGRHRLRPRAHLALRRRHGGGDVGDGAQPPVGDVRGRGGQALRGAVLDARGAAGDGEAPEGPLRLHPHAGVQQDAGRLAGERRRRRVPGPGDERRRRRRRGAGVPPGRRGPGQEGRHHGGREAAEAGAAAAPIPRPIEMENEGGGSPLPR